MRQLSTRLLASLLLAVAPMAAGAEESAPRNPSPYAAVDWNNAQHIHTTSHGHQTDQATLDRAAAAGLRFSPSPIITRARPGGP